MKSIRQIAVETLLRINKAQSWSNRSIDAVIEKHGLSGLDGAFLTALVYGVLERRITLDFCISAHCRMPVAKLQPKMLEILRISFYQLLYMDRVPEHSAVYEGVELAKRLLHDRAGSMANGILRSFIRAGKVITLPEDANSRLSVEHSIPVPLVELWRGAYGDERTLAVLRSSLISAPVYLRVNTIKTNAQALITELSRDGTDTVSVPELAGCLRAEKAGALYKTRAYRDGLFHIQDISSQLCCLALGVSPGMRVLDACAAPGGKSFTIAQHMENRGELVAADLRGHRVEQMEKQVLRLGLSAISARRMNMEEFATGLGEFDRVLCDAPCSGYGVIRRKPEIKYKALEGFSSLPGTQYRILDNISGYCKKGGLLLHSTCTLNPAENEKIAARFLEEHPEFKPAPLPGILGGDWQKTIMAEFNGDCFYMALMRRKEL